MSNLEAEGLRIASVEEVKTIQLGILCEIKTFCEQNNIKFYMAYGSLIGAVRHEGFIPWDDDIDVWMSRSDYNQFIKNFNEYTLEYEVKFCGCKEWTYTYGKVIYKNSKFIEGDNSVIGINVDIFPIDNLPDSKWREKLLFGGVDFFHRMYDLKSSSFSSLYHLKWYKCISYSIIKCILSVLPFRIISFFVDTLAKCERNTNSEWVGVLVDHYLLDQKFLRMEFNDMTMAKFENLTLPIPIGYDSILRRIYGDYMKLPPEEERITHHTYEAYIYRE